MKLLLLLTTAGISLAPGTVPSIAMDFQIGDMKDGAKSLIGIGQIVPGDAEKFSAALTVLPRDAYGLKEFALISPGGDVGEAFRMVSVMDYVGSVLTIVPDGGVCGSACASILFVSGEYKIVVGKGLLAMHTCFGPDGQPVDYCNDAMAQNAVEHGVAYGSVMAFAEAAGPKNAIWFSADDARCFGLVRWPGEPPASQQDAPCVIAAIKSLPK